MGSLNEYFEQSRNDLLDLSLRNNFLNTKDSKSNSVRIINESSIEVFKLLVEKGNKMYFDSRRDKIAEEQDSEFNALFQLPPIESIDRSSLTDNKLQTNHGPKDLQRRLLSISRNARLSIEEKGINTLFLALGFIRWYEHENSESPRIAPTLLVPVEIHRTSINSQFKIWFNEDDITSNISFFKKMLNEFGIEVNPPEDFEIESVVEFYNILRERIAIPKWEFLENEIRLGLFSFHKFLMYSDLDAKKWPDDNKPFQHPVLSSLLGSGFIYDSTGENKDLEDGSEIPFEETYHVLPADSSQQEVIFAIRDGLNTIVQGPPGTGKSQTITNIISDFLARGKKVLFVAEKLAALRVVSNRLNACGLGDLSIELHSDKANKKEFLKEIERVLKLGKPTINVEVARKLVEGDGLRDAVNRYAKAVNQEVEGSGFSPIESFGYIIEAQEKLNGEIYDLSLDRVKVGGKENFNNNTKLIEDIAKILEKTGSLPEHPFSKLRPKDFTYYDVESFFKKLKRLQKQLAESLDILEESNKSNSEWTALKTVRQLEKFERSIKYVEESDQPKLKTDYGANIFEDHDLILELYELSKDLVVYKNRIAKYESQLIDSFWSANVTRHYINLNKHSRKWLKFLISGYKKSRNEVLSYFIDQESRIRDSDLVAICLSNLEGCKLNSRIHNLNSIIKKITDEPFDHYSRRWNEMEVLTGWYLGYHKLLEKDLVFENGLEFVWKPESIHKPGLQSSQLKQFLNEVNQLVASARYTTPINVDDVDLHELNEEMERWIENESSFNQYNQLLKNIEKIKDCDLDWIEEVIEKWDKAPNHIHHLFNYYWFNAIADKALRDRPELKYFVGDNHSSAVQNYCEFEDNLLEVNKYRARLRHWEGLPNSSLSAGVLGILKSQFAKKRKLKSIRRLISECGELILDIKPLFLMSPMSVAQFIETDKIEFDLVIFDEASQIRPVEAFGSILRGKQLVVVGDSKQLPPTSFFDLAIEEEDEEYEDEVATSDVESILSLASAKNMPEKMLRWHYRSKHESLIAISNREFYDSNLLVFPSAFLKTPDRGFYHHLTEDTYYVPGKGGRVNREEAKTIVAKVFEHARERSSQSLGVVAFSKVQARLIQDYIENELRMNPESTVEQYLYGNNLEEKFFVKNLENVQGDERDVIFISVGYGRQESGKFSYNFGPVSKEGGERRLNVLFSRAKLKCVVFSNFTADEMDLSKTDSFGFKVLRSYLLYAEKREIDSIVINSQEKFDSKFEEQVSNALIKNGFDIQNQVGSQGFWIDIGVKHPVEKGRFILAVECDGAKYHSSKIARDRDKSRQLILEMQGWKFYRIWSTDWFLNTHREIEKLISYVNGIINEELPEDRVYIKDGIKINTSYETKETPLQISNYEKYDDLVELLNPLHEESLYGLICSIVEKEQPIHREVILRRILEVTNTARAGSRIQSNFEHYMSQVVIDSDIRSDDNEFYYSNDSLECASSEGLIRKRSNMSRRESSVKYISPHEIQNAILLLVERSYGISAKEIENEVPRLFGFSRSIDDFRIVIRKELENLQSKERFQLQNDLYLIQQ